MLTNTPGTDVPNLRDETLEKVIWCDPDDLDCSLLVELEYSDAEIEQYQRTILARGGALPIVVGDDGWIVTGRGRVEAALLLGIYNIPALRLSSMTFGDLNHYIETLVRFGQNAGWTNDMLNTDLGHLYKLNAMAQAAATCLKSRAA